MFHDLYIWESYPLTALLWESLHSWGLEFPRMESLVQCLTSTVQVDLGASHTQPVSGTAVEATAKVGLLGPGNV